MDLVGWVGGFGVYCPRLRTKHTMPNPEGERQTNTAAELFAVLWLLEHFTTGRILIALDSKIVNDAITGGVHKWKANIGGVRLDRWIRYIAGRPCFSF